MQSNHGQHAAGFSFLGAVGVVATQLTGGARAGVVDVLNAKRATLPGYFGGEIDFVVGWANARTELDDHIRGIGAEAFNHLSDCVCHDAKLGAFTAGMHKADRRRCWIYDVNCATVSDINAERDTALIGNNAIAARKFAAHRATATAIDHGDVISVDLFGGEQRPIRQSRLLAEFPDVWLRAAPALRLYRGRRRCREFFG